MENPDLLDRLRQHKSLGAAPTEELAWLAAHGIFRSFQSGEVTTHKSQPEEWLHVALTGRVAIHLDRGTGTRRIIEWRGGDVFGLMPYSRGGSPPGDTVVEEPTETIAIHSGLLPTMIRECPTITARLVHAMLDRARHITSSDLYDEKLVSLGKFAAGLAHELNNPAAAAARSVQLFAKGLAEVEQAARTLAAALLSPPQLAAIDAVRELCRRQGLFSRSPLERADREDSLGSWLVAHRIDDSIAASLSETSVTLESLESLESVLPADALEAALRWTATSRELRILASEIETSVSGIHQLVTAVKGFTYMDRLPAPEAVDITRGITDTIAVLRGKARAKSVEIRADLDPCLPRVLASGAELNQVWANLIDNAIDAAPISGHVEVTAGRELDRIIVRIVDDGPGIPREIQGRIFDPFVTTKGVGQGTGLGLDLARRLVQRQAGEIEVDSRPGHTQFQVSLAVAAP